MQNLSGCISAQVAAQLRQQFRALPSHVESALPPGRSGRTDVPPPPHPIRAPWRRARSDHAPLPAPATSTCPGSKPFSMDWAASGNDSRPGRLAPGRSANRETYSANASSCSRPVTIPRIRRAWICASTDTPGRDLDVGHQFRQADRSRGATTPMPTERPDPAKPSGCSAPGTRVHQRHRSRPDRSCRWQHRIQRFVEFSRPSTAPDDP